jgi:hypothetical protein
VRDKIVILTLMDLWQGYLHACWFNDACCGESIHWLPRGLRLRGFVRGADGVVQVSRMSTVRGGGLPCTCFDDGVRA